MSRVEVIRFILFRLLIVKLNSMNHVNIDPLIQVLVWDQTPNKVGGVLMNNLRDPAFPAANQYSFITRSNIGHLLEVNVGGWMVPRRQGVDIIFVVLREGPDFDFDAIEKNIQGTFQVNFKQFI